MNRFKKIISTFLIFSLSSLFPLFSVVSFAEPVNTSFYSENLDVHVGDTVTVRLNIAPTNATPIFTVSALLTYDKDLLNFEKDQYINNNWFPLNRTPYFLTDTSNGQILRTAGYPQGLTKPATFLEYTFTAMATGDAIINLAKGKALNSENDDSGIIEKNIHINNQLMLIYKIKF